MAKYDEILEELMDKRDKARALKKKKQKVSEESSASVLGPMIPQIPQTPHMTKGDNPMGIPNELLEFVYNPDATHTIMVERAFEQTAADFKANNLPFKVRKLTIERAVLRVKIAWLGKLPNKKDRVQVYKKRLVEVEQALRKISNSVSSAEEKTKLQKDIAALDKQVTSDTKRKIKNKQIVENVNALIQESVDEGLLPKEVLETKLTEEMLESSYVDFEVDEELLQEGANWDLHKELKSQKKLYKKYLKECKRALEKKKYDEADKAVAKVKEVVADLQKYLDKYPKEDLNPTLFGLIFGFFKFIVRGLITSVAILIPIFGTGGAAALATGITSGATVGLAAGAGTVATLSAVAYPFAVIGRTLYELYHWLDGIIENLSRHKKKYETNDISVINQYYNECLLAARKMQKVCDKLSEEISKMKKYEKSQETKESVEEETEDLSVYKELTETYEAGLMDYDSFSELYMEAKKPDDGMMDILKKLNAKGYKTKYSCSGHKSSFKEDRNKDGIINGKMASGARIMFKGDYEFPDPPKHWGWKTVDGKDYLYVLPISHNAKKEDSQKAFDAWKNKYMASLDRWVDSLKDVSVNSKVVTKDNPKKEEDITESVVEESTDDLRSVDDMIRDEMELFLMESNFFDDDEEEPEE